MYMYTCMYTHTYTYTVTLIIKLQSDLLKRKERKKGDPACPGENMWKTTEIEYDPGKRIISVISWFHIAYRKVVLTWMKIDWMKRRLRNTMSRLTKCSATPRQPTVAMLTTRRFLRPNLATKHSKRKQLYTSHIFYIKKAQYHIILYLLYPFIPPIMFRSLLQRTRQASSSQVPGHQLTWCVTGWESHATLTPRQKRNK